MTSAASPGMLGRMCRRLARPWLLGALLLGGCTSGTETGNPSFGAALSYTGYSSQPDAIGVRQPGSRATVDNAWFDLEQVTVAQRGACGIDGDEVFEIPALGLGDHAAGNHNSTVFEGRPGAFCEVELPLARVTESGAPVALEGHALLLEGTLADGTAFSIVSDATPTVVLSAAAGGFELDAASPDALVAFDFASWLGDIDFDGAQRKNGELVISVAENSELLAAFDARLASGIALYRDRDADGVLDAKPELLARAR
ncbi:MAG TPA: hypothetical protein VHB79_02140 [Polyangiaceae bacterium]|nr:hypothetical protein [Polyangiaceae bacterium]